MSVISNLPTNHHIIVSRFLQFTSSGVVSPKPNESTFTTTYSYSMKSKISPSVVSWPFPPKIGHPFWETHIRRNIGPDLTGIIHQPFFDPDTFWKYRGPLLFGSEQSANITVGRYKTHQLAGLLMRRPFGHSR